MRAEEADWEGAAERLLHGFALSILVPDEHYRSGVGLDQRPPPRAALVYYRVAESPPARIAPPTGPTTLAAKLEIKDTPFAPWLERELASRAGARVRRDDGGVPPAARAVTKAGQIKGGGGRHEKDDRHRIDDRSTYVLGWTNERKIDALLDRAAEVQRAAQPIPADAGGAREGGWTPRIERRDVLAGLAETREFAEIDWQSRGQPDRGA